MTMDTEADAKIAEPPKNYHQDVELDGEFEIILKFLTGIEEICFKSQQRGEPDLTREEKFKIGADVFNKNKLQFLVRFGDHLLSEHLPYFRKFTSLDYENSDDITIILNDLSKKTAANQKSYNVKNRRYEALMLMISEDSYFSEIEMMKRNPLLYEQLVGQYLTRDEKRERDKHNLVETTSFVKVLMEGIERNDAEVKRRDQEKIEDNAMEESDSESEDDEMEDGERRARTLWGEFENEGKRHKTKFSIVRITAEEKKLLKEEFVTSMYESFLDGADEDFDYSTVDCNAKYDCVETLEHDEEDKYFDSEEPAVAPVINDEEQESSEDELDIYMSALDDNPNVRQLSSDMKKVNTNN